MLCRLCSSKNICLLQTIRREQLISKWAKLGISTSYLLRNDLEYMLCKECDLRFYKPMITGDENFYNALQKFDWYYMDNKKEFKYAIDVIKSDDEVLEIGSGSGGFLKQISAKRFVGLELSQEAIKIAAERSIRLENEIIEDHARNHKDHYNVVCSFQVLEHVNNPHSFLQSAVDVLKSGGIMIVAVPSEDSFLKYTETVLNMPPHHVTRWSDKILENITKIFGLQLLEIYHEKFKIFI